MFEMNVSSSWYNVLKQEFTRPYMEQLKSFLNTEIQAGRVIYPEPKNYFTALEATSFENVKIVILGQDPYHGPGQAHGLSFSVQSGVKKPPSLKNIFKELGSDLGCPAPDSGDLSLWASRGVLLLNSTLTVEDGKPASHSKKGWELFTDKIIQVINDERENVVFFLWGSHAQKKAQHVDRTKHLVIESPHPSPLSSHRGFFGSKPFSRANVYLQKNGREPVNWDLSGHKSCLAPIYMP